MRTTPNNAVRFGKRYLGGDFPLICVPLVGKTPAAIREEIRKVHCINPDVIEARIDAWDFVEDVPTSLAMLRELRRQTEELPLILTCRGDWEGGFQKVAAPTKFEIYSQAVKECLADAIDVELAYGHDTLRDIRRMLQNSRILLIVSAHDFQKTPPVEVLYSTLRDEIRAGADVAKLAVTPESEEDVLALFSATLAVRREYPNVPLITMSMGKTGAISRIAGGLFGSDLSFAVGSAASAPGQLPLEELRRCFKTVYR